MSIKRILSSLSTSVFLPLIPFALALVIRGIFWGQFRWEMFEPAEITFAVAMYLMMCMIGSKNLTDKELANSLFTPYLTFALVFIALFTLSVFLSAYSASIVSETLNLLRVDSNAKIVNHIEPIIHRIRIMTLFLSILVIVFSEIARNKYKIEV